MTSGEGFTPGVAADNATGPDITIVSDEAQIVRLLPLLRAYRDFYQAGTSDASLHAISRALVADPAHEGMQLLASDRGEDVGFATLFWSWETLVGGRVGVMNDLYVVGSARRRGVATALIRACVQHCRDHGALQLRWQTVADNLTAQAVYERVGATRESWVDYWLGTRETRQGGTDIAGA